MAAADHPTPVRLHRFTVTERVLHWAVVITFTIMLGTGAALFFPSLARLMNRPMAKEWHLWSAIAMGVCMVVIPLVGNRRAVLRSVREVQYMDHDDVTWLKSGPVAQMGTIAPAPQGRFNAGQKLNTALLSGGIAVMYITGFLLWYGERDTNFRLAGSIPIHDLFTIGLVGLVTGHVYLGLIHPTTRAAMRGMVTGEVSRTYAEHHHAKWVEELDDAAEIMSPSD